MSETTKGAELALPFEAFLALSRLTAPSTDAGPVTVVRAIAAPVVAAELRAQADRIATHSARLAQMYAHRLRVRADEVEAT